MHTCQVAGWRFSHVFHRPGVGVVQAICQQDNLTFSLSGRAPRLKSQTDVVVVARTRVLAQDGKLRLHLLGSGERKAAL